MTLAHLGRRSRALGSVNWAFVITLFLLIGFIFMWYQATDERDRAKEEKERTEKAYKDSSVQVEAAITALEEISSVTGFRNKNITLGGRAVVVTDPAQARLHLDKAGEVEVVQPDGSKTKVPGFMNALWNHTKVTIDQASRSGTNTATAERTIDLSMATPAFRDAVKKLAALRDAIPPKPAPPIDSGDRAAEAKYSADLAAYEAAVNTLKEAMTAFHQSGTFQNERSAFKNVIGITTRLDPDTWKAIELSFAPKLDVPVTSLEQVLPLWSQVWESILAEFRANKGADRQTIDKLQADLAAERKVVAEQNKRYAELQTVSKSELDAKTAELTTANKRAADNEQAASRANNDLQVQITERKQEVAALQAALAAHKARLASDKEARDLEVRRDEVDGTVIAIDHTLETGTINLGSDDKVYPGLKFVVSYVDRGGARQPKGEVQVISVTGRKSSKVRIVSAVSQMGTGDLISNPFFNSQKGIHIYPVGWSPDFIQRERLKRMNVTIDTAPSARTDYYVIPDDWQGGTPAPAAEGEEAAAVGSTPLDKARQEAVVFGAQLITKRMLENFLKL
jgi:hypothetical protein